MSGNFKYTFFCLTVVITGAISTFLTTPTRYPWSVWR